MELRYYPKDNISEFMSESMSFLLRKAQDEQLEKGDKLLVICFSMFTLWIVPLIHSLVDSSNLKITGMKMILSEVAHPSKKAGGVGVLYNVMRGTYGRLHSKAGRVLSFLLKDSTLSFLDNFPQGKFYLSKEMF